MAFYGIYGPKGLPRDIVDKVNSAAKKTLEDPAVRKRIEETGSIIIGNTLEQFAKQINAEYEIYKKMVAGQKLKLEELAQPVRPTPDRPFHPPTIDSPADTRSRTKQGQSAPRFVEKVSRAR